MGTWLYQPGESKDGELDLFLHEWSTYHTLVVIW